jgi:hypothetical protein
VAKTTNYYDLIVLGDDIAGLVAAALVARRGKRVLVMPHGYPDGTYKFAGRSLTLDTAPVVHLTTPPVRRVFHELGLLQLVRRQPNHEPLLHVVAGEHRLDLEPDDRNFAEEVAREWPTDPVEDAWALQRRWTEATEEVLSSLLGSDGALSSEGFWGRRYLSRIEAQLPGPEVDPLEPLALDHPMRRIARVCEPWLQHLSPTQLGTAASLRLCGLWGTGASEFPPGQQRLRELLLQRVALHSGEIKRDLRAGEVLFRRGRVVGITLLGKHDRYGCDHLIVASDPRRFIEGALPAEQLPRPLGTTLDSTYAVARRFVMHVELHERGLSPAIAGMVLCVPPAETAQHGIGAQYIRLHDRQAEMRRISITRIIPADGNIDTLRETTLGELDEAGVLPFCHRHIHWVHSPHDGRDATDAKGAAIDRFPIGGMKAAMECLYGIQGAPTLGVGLLPHQSGIKGLHFASRLTLAGLGLEGEFVTGTAVASLIANPAKSPFSRSSLLSRA